MTRNATPGPVRPVLTRERIVLAAVALIERESADALSMRRVAAELGVAVMSLYNHVPNKSALLEGVAEHVVSGLELHDDPSEPWQERARALVRAFRKVAHDNPRCMTIVLTHKIDTRSRCGRPSAPWRWPTRPGSTPRPPSGSCGRCSPTRSARSCARSG